MRLSIIIPCYNEEKTLKSTIKRVVDTFRNIEYELILVDDGSTDNTEKEILKGFKAYPEKIRFHFSNENKGKGNAFYHGVKLAKYDLILLLDCDLSVDPNNFFSSAIYEILSDKSKPFIIATQRRQVIPQPLYRIFVGKCFKVLVFVLTGLYMDTQNPFKLFYRMKEHLIDNKVDGFAFDVEILYNAKLKGISIFKTEVDYLNNEDSKVTFRKTLTMLLDLYKIRYSLPNTSQRKDDDS